MFVVIRIMPATTNARAPTSHATTTNVVTAGGTIATNEDPAGLPQNRNHCNETKYPFLPGLYQFRDLVVRLTDDNAEPEALFEQE